MNKQRQSRVVGYREQPLDERQPPAEPAPSGECWKSSVTESRKGRPTRHPPPACNGRNWAVSALSQIGPYQARAIVPNEVRAVAW
jgi:hypothetical protein